MSFSVQHIANSELQYPTTRIFILLNFAHTARLLIGCCQFKPDGVPPELRENHSVVQNDIEQRLMNLDAAVVLNKSQASKAVHKEAHPGPGATDHLRQRFLRDLRKKCFCFPGLTKLLAFALQIVSLVLGHDGYKIAGKGTNGFLCVVERSSGQSTDQAEFWNLKMRAPHCSMPKPRGALRPST